MFYIVIIIGRGRDSPFKASLASPITAKKRTMVEKDVLSESKGVALSWSNFRKKTNEHVLFLFTY